MTSVEVFGSLLLGTGGVNGYEGVRKRTTTKKGEKVVEYQGYTPTKHNTTAAYKTEHDAAVARAVLKENLRLGLVEDKKLRAKKSAKKRAKRGCRARSPSPPPLLPFSSAHARCSSERRAALDTLACVTTKVAKVAPKTNSMDDAIALPHSVPRCVPQLRVAVRPLSIYQAALLLQLGAPLVRARPMA